MSFADSPGRPPEENPQSREKPLPKAPPLSVHEPSRPEPYAGFRAVADGFLTVAQILTVISSILIVGYVLDALQTKRGPAGPFVLAIAGCCGLCYNVALFIVFNRAKNWK